MSSRCATPKLPRQNGATDAPRVVVPSGKFSTGAPCASRSWIRRSVTTRSVGSARSTNTTPSPLAIGPTSGQLATSPLAIGIAGHTGRIAIGSR